MKGLHYTVLAILRVTLASTTEDIARLLRLPAAVAQRMLDDLEADGVVATLVKQFSPAHGVLHWVLREQLETSDEGHRALARGGFVPYSQGTHSAALERAEGSRSARASGRHALLLVPHTPISPRS